MEFNFVQDAGYFVAGAIGSAAVLVKKWWPTIKRGTEAAINAYEHLKSSHAAAHDVQDAEQAAVSLDPQLRDALVHKAVREALSALKIEAGQIGETYRDGIIQYASSVVPDAVKPFVPQLLDATLQAIQAGDAAALNHPAIQAVKMLKATTNVALSAY